MPVQSSDIVLIVIGIIFPPAAVLLLTGCSVDFLINLLLTLVLGYLPGQVHALWLIYLMLRARGQHGRGGFVYVGTGHYVATPQMPHANQRYGHRMFYGDKKKAV
jgi:uncharacterized membrane protein YqaE (UPF0057 family)